MTKNLNTDTKNSTSKIKFKILKSLPRPWDNYEASAYLEVKNPKTNRYTSVNYYTRLRDAYKGIERWLNRNGLSNKKYTISFS